MNLRSDLSPSISIMDLLGSIMGSMSAPPGLSQKEKDKRKKMREMQKKVIAWNNFR